jgi:multidrug efflux pump subunit AcrA (membrane-fusion protein)
MYKVVAFTILFAIVSCAKKEQTIKPTRENIVVSVYASGYIKAASQYQVFANVSGIVQQVWVQEGDTVQESQPMFTLLNETSKLSKENAALAAEYNDYAANQAKLREMEINIEFARNKMQNDSLLWVRQQSLWAQQIGSRNDLEQRELAYKNSKTAYHAAMLRYDDMKKQLQFLSRQSKKNLSISQQQLNDFTVKSEIHGRVYSILKEKGEMVNPQTPLAVLGSANEFIIELQVDEYDIVKIKNGQPVFVTMDSYKNEVFEAEIIKVFPLMNERSKTFTVNAAFKKMPEVLYPNLTVEANIVVDSKTNVLTIPLNAIGDSSYVLKKNGDRVKIETGLRDYKKTEVLSGITESDELIQP